MITVIENQLWYWAAQFWRCWEMQMRLHGAFLEAMGTAPGLERRPALRLVVDNGAAPPSEPRRHSLMRAAR